MVTWLFTDDEERASTHHWCAGVPLLQLLHQAEHAYPQSYCQDLVCSPVNNHSYPSHFCLGAAADPHTQGGLVPSTPPAANMPCTLQVVIVKHRYSVYAIMGCRVFWSQANLPCQHKVDSWCVCVRVLHA